VDTKLARILEPRAPRPDLRIRAVARLRQAGLRAGVLCSPVMPEITDSRASIESVARAAAQANASFFVSGALFLKPCSLPTFFDFVQQHFPAQLEAYRRRYGTSAFVSPEYRRRIAELVNAACRKYNLGRLRHEELPTPPPSATVTLQPWLPFVSDRGS